MTSMSVSSAGPGKVSGTISPEDRGRSSVSISGSGSGSVSGTGTGVEPDFVDERIRAEIASLRDQEDRGDFEGDGVVDYGDEDEFWDGDEYGDDGSEYDYSTDETHDEFDEADLQRLTRERGFGLGSWIDRLVEWTLFGVEEWPALAPASSTSASNATRIGTTPTTTTVTFEEPPTDQSERDNGGDELLEGDHDFDTVSVADDEVAEVGKPGSQGGWEDVGWLFRAVKRAII